MMRTLFRLLPAVASAAASFAQTTWYVDASGTPPGTGTVQDPYTSLQYAIAQAATVDGDTLLVLPGDYVENVDFLGKTLAVESTAGAGATALLGAQPGPVVQLVQGEGPGTRLAGFRIADGIDFPPNGGQGLGVRILGATVELAACRIEDNQGAFDGAGLWAESAAVTVVDTVLVANRAVHLGGGAYLSHSQAAFHGCEFLQNGDFTLGGRAGAVYAHASDVSFDACAFTSNAAAVLTAGVWVAGGTADFQGCDFAGNQCQGDAAALLVDGAAVTARATHFRGNLAHDGYAAIVVRAAGDLELTSCRIEDSFASSELRGGGLAAFGGANARLERVRFLQNEAGEGAALYADTGATVALDSCAFLANRSTAGGAQDGAGSALWVGGATVTAKRCFFEGNHSDAAAGALGSVVEGPAVLRHCTLVGNTASTSGAGVVGGVLESSIVWGNTLPSASGATTASWSDVQGGWPGVGNLDLDPLLDPSGALTAGSPCIDAGDPAAPRDDDGSPTDMGAFAWQWPAVGASYCVATVNSTGAPAVVAAYGVDQAGGEPLFLRATSVPPQHTGFFLTSLTQGFVPNVGGGQGNLCLGGQIGRFAQQVQSSGAEGVLAISVDTQALPVTPPHVVVAGETWSFQAWFRDDHPGATSNLSDGVGVTFL